MLPSQRAPAHPRRLWEATRLWVALCLGLVVPGCGDGEKGPYPMEPGRERAAPDRPVPPGGTALERLPVVDSMGRPVLLSSLPQGWEALPPTPMRSISVRIPGQDGEEPGDLSVSFADGRVDENVNRWLGQFGGAPLDENELLALPTHPLLGGAAVLVEAEGRYDGGMGGGGAKEGWALLGLVSTLGPPRLFVKLVGPASLVKREREAVLAYAASIYRAGVPLSSRIEAGRPPPSGERAPAPVPGGSGGGERPAAPRPPGLDASRLEWTLPAGWSDARPTRMMRIRDFRFEGASPSTEAVLFQLGGDGGGLALNINRWRGQLGQPELSAAEIAALPKVAMLGKEATWIEIRGHFRGMSGEDIKDALFVGVVLLLERDALFFRFSGPEAEVAPQVEAFKALVTSLRLKP